MSYLSLGNAYYAHNNLYTRDPIMNHRENVKLTENNNEVPVGGNDKLQEIWHAHTFESSKNEYEVKLDDLKISWVNETAPEERQEKPKICEEKSENDDAPPSSPSHHARRPMNAFLIFCKKHRPIVRDRFPTLENRGVTKILGEWWSLLDEPDKMPFTNLANEYKDAFLSANPHFKWYKLPAPPLRTLNVKTPHTIQKLPSPITSNQPSQEAVQNSTEFTPGKLADESQLGSLTSLLNNNFNYVCSSASDKCVESKESNNNVEHIDSDIKTPVNLETPNGINLPPKPIKKRIFEQYFENEMKAVPCDKANEFKDDFDGQDFGKKPGRQCKGKRYEKFMVEGKLLGNKKDTKLTQNKPLDKPNRLDIETPKLETTIKRLAERTKGYVDQQSPNKEHEDGYNSNFDLHERIQNLPSLSYEAFVQKKRESKKRKFRINTSEKHVPKQPKIELVGAKKRKNKNNITHLEKVKESAEKPNQVGFDDLLGLATLAEVASNTQKINEI